MPSTACRPGRGRGRGRRRSSPSFPSGCSGGPATMPTIIYRSIEKSNSEMRSARSAAPGAAARDERRAAGRHPRGDSRRRRASSSPNKGYAATGTREIATMVGLRQASLFHYFARKEDLFAELLDRTVSPALPATAWLMQHPGRPEVRLYALAHHDVTNLCGSRHNLAALQLLPEARDRPLRRTSGPSGRALRGRYRSLIKEADRGRADRSTARSRWSPTSSSARSRPR